MKVFHISGDERALIYALLQMELYSSMLEIIGAPTTNIDKATRIINQTEFLYALRLKIIECPASGGALRLNENEQVYAWALVSNADGGNMQPHIKALLFQHREALEFKMNDTVRINPFLPNLATTKPKES